MCQLPTTDIDKSLNWIKEDEQLIDSLLESRACSCETYFDPARRALAITGSYTQAPGLLHSLFSASGAMDYCTETQKAWQENATAK